MPGFDLQAVRHGDRLALSKALTMVENQTPDSREVLAALFPYTGNAHLVGVTGAPGTGKSTLVNQLVMQLHNAKGLEDHPKIAVIAVDPTSPFTGGALLGDRIRMRDLAGDKNVFIRSMASRGALGGLAHQTASFVTVLDGAGFDLIMIETVGAGQAEVDIASLAHTVIVVEAPGLGDDIQAIKAGILEIADIIVVNKADRPGADNTARALQVMLEMAQGSKLATSGQITRRLKGKHILDSDQPSSSIEQPGEPGWDPPVRKITATDGTGIPTLIEDLHRHAQYLRDSQMWQQKEARRLRRDLEALVRDLLVSRWRKELDENQFESVLADVVQRKYSPIEAVEMLL